MFATVQSAAYFGITAYPVQIEVDIAYALPQVLIVGLPDTGVKESRERIRAAIKNSGFSFPPEKITINLAPADIKKEGAAFDLPMALGILAAADLIPKDKLAQFSFLGELALDGSIRPIKGAIVMTSGLKTKHLVLPFENAKEAALEKNAHIYGAKNLSDVIAFLKEEGSLPLITSNQSELSTPPMSQEINFSEVRGQSFAKRALEIAVAGGHNLIFLGAPGSGKTMLAKRIPTILPPPSFEDALTMTKIHSVTGRLPKNHALMRTPPFRSPHHSSSLVALTGGGSWPKPGEVSLAHGGVLFLDEFPEFRRDALEALRGPLEDGEIHISRAKMQVTYPARALLVAAMNPCPCGYLTDPGKACRCTIVQIRKYQSKVSGPILDRIDLHVEVMPVTLSQLTENHMEESSEAIRKRIIACREKQRKRYQHRPFSLNAHMQGRDIKKFASPDNDGHQLMETAMNELHLSARAYFKILKVSRTIADLANEQEISTHHIAEAIQYRSLDRE